ncbi:hypothetical protein [Paracoccus sp. Ld10]|uniref:hypothetical protein n=1 Tax=Paracoccus sp. Ld10 TaxID=649158 RepID=UPI00386DD3B3
MFRLSMSGEDWALIDTALTAYSHNSVYRTLREKLDMQVAMVRAMDGASRSAQAGTSRHDAITSGPATRTR